MAELDVISACRNIHLRRISRITGEAQQHQRLPPRRRRRRRRRPPPPPPQPSLHRGGRWREGGKEKKISGNHV